MTATADVVIAGGGVIGAAIAWRAAASGLDVAVVDPGAGDGAYRVAAGMLAPVSESLFGEDDLLALNLLAARRFPEFAAELEEASGQSVRLRRDGTLAVAYDPGDLAALRRLTDFRRSLGLATQELDGRECRALEPFLAPGVGGGFLFAGDWSVDNRRYVAALRQAMAAAGARAVPGRVARVRAEAGRVRGVALQDGTEIGCATVVVAAGWASAGIEGVPEPVRGAVRPVKGQVLRLRTPDGLPPVLTHTVRATVRGFEVYLVPRADGELVVGATSDERADTTVTAGAVHDLLRDAMSVVPVLSELAFAEASAGLRPGTVDNGPILGATGVGGLLVATGHYRNGILLSAATAEAVAALLTRGEPAGEWAPFAPGRLTAEALS